MKRSSVLIIAAVLGLAPVTGFAQQPQPQEPRGQNLEPSCRNTGSGMDPRCVGDSTSGGVSDMTTSREQRSLQGVPPPAAVVAPRQGDAVIIDRR